MANSPKKTILSVFGTRPEAIKMAPVIQQLSQHTDRYVSKVCVTAQHRDMLDQVLDLFHIQPDVDLNLMQANQDLTDITVRVLTGMRDVLAELKPDMVLVHGDTTTTMAASLAAFYAKIPVGHVEAGLRTYDKYYPFPEEINRVVTDSVASLYFAPTQHSVNQLIKAGIQSDAVYLTGNTVIDALLYTLDNTAKPPLPFSLKADQQLVLVTVHRRENFGEPLLGIMTALKTLVERFPSIVLVLPVHPNPNVKSVVTQHLSEHPRIHLIDPLDYHQFCHVMAQSHLILTDSGGIQEEAPTLGKPVLVLRDETERPEAVELGAVALVGPHTDAIVTKASELLSNPAAYKQMAGVTNPYGDGTASEKIVQAMDTFFFSQTSSCDLNVPSVL